MSLAAENVKLAFWIAARYPARDADAVRSEALLGLVEAEKAHDPCRGKYGTLAAHIARQRVGREVLRQRRLADAEETLVRIDWEGHETIRPDIPPTPAPDVEAPLMALRVREAVAGLDPREAEVIRARFGLEGEEETLATIGAALGLSRARIGQIERTALRKLRRALSRKGTGR